MMKLQDVILKAMAKKISWLDAAEIIGVCDRTMRRMREGYQKFGYDGLRDGRSGKQCSHRVPMATAEEVLRLYREVYFDLNIRHFHEKLRDKHQIQLSYTWVQLALQGAGLVAKRRKRGPHRRRRPRRPLPGMLLHIDGSKHRWLNDDRWHDLIVILDDATSEIYYAQLVEEESTRTVMAGLREVIETKGLFCALYSDSTVQRQGKPFLRHREGRRQSGQEPADAGGAGDEGVRGADDRSLFAAGPGSLGAQFWNLAGAAAAGTASGRDHDGGRSQRLSAGAVYRRVQWEVQRGGGAERYRVPPNQPERPELDLHGTDRAGGGQRQYSGHCRKIMADRQNSLSSYAGRLHGDDPRTSGWKPLDPLWPSCRRALPSKRGTPWKSAKPAKTAAFSLSHRDDMRAIADREASIQMFVDRHRAAGQRMTKVSFVDLP